jgi:hypothetical protein
MTRKILCLAIVCSAFPAFSQLTPVFPVKMNEMAHLSSYSAKVYYDFFLSPWGNWVFTAKQYVNPTSTSYKDSIQLLLYKAFDTTKKIYLTTLFPQSLGRLSVWIKEIYGRSTWSPFQDTVYFSVVGSTINHQEYPDCGYPGEIFFIDLSSICKVRIHDIEYTEPPTSLFKQSSPVGTPKPLAKINVVNTSNKQLKINYSIPSANYVCLNIYDIKGSLVRALIQEKQTEGEHFAYWDCLNNRGENLSSGPYLFQVISGDYISATEQIYVK